MAKWLLVSLLVVVGFIRTSAQQDEVISDCTRLERVNAIEVIEDVSARYYLLDEQAEPSYSAQIIYDNWWNRYEETLPYCAFATTLSLTMGRLVNEILLLDSLEDFESSDIIEVHQETLAIIKNDLNTLLHTESNPEEQFIPACEATSELAEIADIVQTFNADFNPLWYQALSLSDNQSSQFLLDAHLLQQTWWNETVLLLPRCVLGTEVTFLLGRMVDEMLITAVLFASDNTRYNDHYSQISSLLDEFNNQLGSSLEFTVLPTDVPTARPTARQPRPTGTPAVLVLQSGQYSGNSSGSTLSRIELSFRVNSDGNLTNFRLEIPVLGSLGDSCILTSDAVTVRNGTFTVLLDRLSNLTLTGITTSSTSINISISRGFFSCDGSFMNIVETTWDVTRTER